MKRAICSFLRECVASRYAAYSRHRIAFAARRRVQQTLFAAPGESLCDVGGIAIDAGITMIGTIIRRLRVFLVIGVCMVLAPTVLADYVPPTFQQVVEGSTAIVDATASESR